MTRIRAGSPSPGTTRSRSWPGASGPFALAGSSTRRGIRAWRRRSARAASPRPTSGRSPRSSPPGDRSTRGSAAARASSAITPSTSTASSGTAPSRSRPTCRGATSSLSFGYNGDASGGVTGVFRHAEARARGLRWVQLEPHLSVTGAGADEWVPIRPKTDAAVLFALLHVVLREHDWRAVCDVPFLERMTSSPYLVGPGGYYLRAPGDRQAARLGPGPGSARPVRRSRVPAARARRQLPRRRRRGRRRRRAPERGERVRPRSPTSSSTSGPTPPSGPRRSPTCPPPRSAGWRATSSRTRGSARRSTSRGRPRTRTGRSRSCSARP